MMARRSPQIPSLAGLFWPVPLSSQTTFPFARQPSVICADQHDKPVVVRFLPISGYLSMPQVTVIYQDIGMHHYVAIKPLLSHGYSHTQIP
jgi:hypothetical protein